MSGYVEVHIRGNVRTGKCPYREMPENLNSVVLYDCGGLLVTVKRVMGHDGGTPSPLFHGGNTCPGPLGFY